MEVQAGVDPRRPFGVKQGVLDGKRHRWRRELGQHRAIGELHEAVHDALGMQHRLALVGPQAEQPLRLHQFEPLVGEGRGIDRDLRAHGPVGMPDNTLCPSRWIAGTPLTAFVAYILTPLFLPDPLMPR